MKKTPLFEQEARNRFCNYSIFVSAIGSIALLLGGWLPHLASVVF
jgi:hypothetical protein